MLERIDGDDVHPFSFVENLVLACVHRLFFICVVTDLLPFSCLHLVTTWFPLVNIGTGRPTKY